MRLERTPLPSSSVGNVELKASVAATAAVVLAVRDEELTRRTPCEGYDVRGVVDHLMGVLTVAEHAGRKAPQPEPTELWTDRMHGDWRARFTELVEAAALAWADDGAWQGETVLLGRTFTAESAGRKLVGELVVHGWDVARATGRDYEPDPAAVRLVHEYFTRTLGESRNAAWGPEVRVREGAPTLDRVLGLSGRDPHWR